MKLQSHFPALASRNFLIFWLGQFVSLIGTWMQTPLLPYLAYRLTNQPIYLGAIGFASSLPAFLFTLPAGVIIERLNKRKVVIAMQAIMMLVAFTLAILTLTNRITIWHLLILAFALGGSNTIEIAARQSMMIELVGKEALPNAIALNSTIFNAARVLGPSFSAPLLLIFIGSRQGWIFAINGFSYLIVIAGLLLIRTEPRIGLHKTPTMDDFWDGQRYIRQSSIIASLILLTTIPGFFGFTFMQQIPVFAQDVLHAAGDTEAIVAARNSFLITAMGVGALIAALSLAIFSNIRRKTRLLTIGEFVFALSLIGLSQSRWLAISLLLMAILGWGMVTQLTLTNTLIQLAVSDDLRGRVLSTYLWAMQGVAPFGSLFIGWLAQNLGAPTAVLVGGLMCLLGYAAIHLRRPGIRQLVM